MLTPILLAMAMAAPPPPTAVTDTTFAVRATARLDVQRAAGIVRVRAWSRSEMRVHAPGGQEQFAVRNAGDRVQVSSRDGQRDGGVLEITVPAGMSVHLSGNSLVIDVEGVAGSVVANTLNGSITVRTSGGSVTAESLNGPITVEDVRGPVAARSTNDDVRISRVTGPITAETVNGRIVVRDVASANVDLSSVNGPIEYRGAIAPNGRYRFATHNGPITAAVPANASATVVLNTMHGRFDAGFPVTMQSGGTDRHFTFTLGGGSARIEMESFNGDLRLIRP
jgi:DUF4097 and DUF4098 domain-containing protein YvlB